VQCKFQTAGAAASDDIAAAQLLGGSSFSLRYDLTRIDSASRFLESCEPLVILSERWSETDPSALGSAAYSEYSEAKHQRSPGPGFN